MPFISFNTTKKLTADQKDQVASMFGKNISLLSGKTESKLMVDISDNHTMYFAGEKRESLVFIDVRLYLMINLFDKKAFTEEIFKGIEKICEIKENEIFLNFIELETWGSMGSLK